MLGRLFKKRREEGPPQPLAAGHATETDRRMMARAIELAEEAARAGEAPIGAVAYETASGRVVAEARNTREGDADPCGHAELLAVRAAAAALGDWRLNECTVVVTLEPCCMCAGALVNARVGRVVFGAFDPKAGAAGSLMNLLADQRLNHRPEVIGGVEAEACGALLREFFRGLRVRKRP
ncbi:MAG: nucleoside deaminase [Phycisphaerales bacterium]|jgi:tRNA(adenine34) deaminase